MDLRRAAGGRRLLRRPWRDHCPA